MNERRQLLVVIGVVVGLLAVASSLPAADPRLDGPIRGDGPADGGSAAGGDWESVVGSGGESTPQQSTQTETPADGRSTDDGEAFDRPPDEAAGLEIEGALEPGNTVTIDAHTPVPSDPTTIVVDGRVVGEVRVEGVDVTVPFAETMTVRAPDKGYERTFDVETTARIVTNDDPIPGRSLDVTVFVGGTRIPDAAITQDGAVVGETTADGVATIELPNASGPTTLRADRGPVHGTRPIQVPAPELRFTSPILFPAAPAPVEVSAGDAGVPNASVTVEGGASAVTDTDGSAWVRLPVDDEATATVTLGEESATATATNLYFQFAAVVVLVPGFVFGLVWTYFRIVPVRHQYHRGGHVALFVALADGLGGLSDALDALASLFRRPSLPMAFPSFTLPRLRWPALPSVSWPTRSFSLPRFGGFGGLVGLLGLLGGGAADGSSSGLRSRLDSLLDDEDDADRDDGESAEDESGEDTAGDAGDAAQGAEQTGGPGWEIWVAWHAFVDRLAVENRESTPPGAIARRAIAAGFPADSVRRLVGTFRAVEYGGRDPTPDRRATARAASEDLLARDPDEEGDQ